MPRSNAMTNFQVKTVDANVNYWVVRAGKSGAYLQNFYENGLVAVGHLDDIEYLASDLQSNEQFLEVLVRYKAHLIENESSLSSASNKAGQVNRFVREMQTGDVIISLDDTHILTGVITSDAYKDATQRVVRDSEGGIIGTPLEYSLRRNVSWGNRVSKNNVPSAIRTSLWANQTIFCVSEHWQTLNHWLSVVFINDDSVYFSSRILQDEDISNFDVSQFSRILNIFDAVSLKLLENELDEMTDVGEYVTNAYRECMVNRSFQLKTQQSFMSPGVYWGSLSGGRTKNIIFIMLFCMLFNHEAVFADGMDDSIAQDYRENVNVIVSHVKNAEGFEHVQEGLVLNLPPQHNLAASQNEGTNNQSEGELEFPSDEPSSTGEI